MTQNQGKNAMFIAQGGFQELEIRLFLDTSGGYLNGRPGKYLREVREKAKKKKIQDIASSLKTHKISVSEKIPEMVSEVHIYRPNPLQCLQ